MEDDTLSLKELLSIDLTKVPEQESLQILDNNFPCCYIIRIGDSLEITLEEHIYTKYWFHKYHASVFAEAMIKAVKRLATEGFPYFSEELDNDDDVHLFVRWALAESIHIPNQTLIDNIELSFNKVYERANNMLENSDSILILGKDTGESMELLKRIQTYLDNKGFYTYILNILRAADFIFQPSLEKEVSGYRRVRSRRTMSYSGPRPISCRLRPRKPGGRVSIHSFDRLSRRAARSAATRASGRPRPYA